MKTPTLLITIRRPCLPVGHPQAGADIIHQYVVPVGPAFDHMKPEFYVRDDGMLMVNGGWVTITPPFIIQIDANFPVP